MNPSTVKLGVTDFVALINQTFDYAMPSVVIVGEVSGYNVRQNKWVRFKLKDDQSSVDFFGSVFQIRTPIEDGMMVAVLGRPRLSDKWGFSVSVQSVQAVGEGSIKKGFELLKAKLDQEGLFDEDRKRRLPTIPRRIGVISSTHAAGYADFIKIINNRWGGLYIDVAHTLVQGIHAPGQITRAIEYFNKQGGQPDVLVIVRGGGDADDLAAFNDEGLVRAVAASRIPTLVGIGHEVDVTLVDLVADVRAATPSNAAELLIPDKRELIEKAWSEIGRILPLMNTKIAVYQQEVAGSVDGLYETIMASMNNIADEINMTQRLLEQYNPQVVLARGYSLVRGDVSINSMITIERQKDIIEAEVVHVKQK